MAKSAALEAADYAIERGKAVNPRFSTFSKECWYAALAKRLRSEDRQRRELERFVMDLKLNDRIGGELWDVLKPLQARILKRRAAK